jgi:6-phosphogluconolactonase
MSSTGQTGREGMMLANKTEIRIVENIEALSLAADEILLHRVTETLRTKEFFAIALSGGSTPRSLLALLATDASFRANMPWDKIHFFWGDERHVPPDHPESNYRMANETMLSKVPVPAVNIHRIRAEEDDASKTAEEYEEELLTFFKLEAGQLPRFDCVLLGMGPDGHTASLFPGTAAVHERERLVVANWVEKFKTYRITLTAHVLNNADTIIFLISGKDKAVALQSVLEGRKQPEHLPAQLIRPKHGNLLWLVDQAAAGKLTSDSGNIARDQE